MATPLPDTKLDFGPLPLVNNYTVTSLDPANYVQLQYWDAWEKGFMAMVQPTQFSIDMLVDLFVSINVGDFNWKVYLKQPQVTGLVALIAIGILYVVFMLLALPIYCCCRCCCSTVKQRHYKNGAIKHRACMSVGNGLCLATIICAIVMIYISSANLITTLTKAGDIVDAAIVDLETVLINAKNDVIFVTVKSFKVMSDRTVAELKAVGPSITTMITTQMATSKNINLQSITDLKNTAATLQGEMVAVTTALTSFQQAITALNGKMSSYSTDGKKWVSQDNCIAAACVIVAALTIAPLAPGPNLDLSAPTQQMTNLVTQLTSIDPSTTIGQTASSGSVGTLTTDAVSQVQDIGTKIDEFTSPMTETIDNQILPQLEGFRNSSHDLLSYPKKFGPYISDTAIGLASYFGFIVILAVVGIGYGFWKYNRRVLPTRRHGGVLCAGRLLVCSNCWILLLAWIFMLIVVVLMLLGTQIDEAICPILLGESNNFSRLSETVTHVNATLTPINLNVGPNAPLDFGGAMTKCMNNATFYVGFGMAAVFNIDDVQKKMDDVNITGKMDTMNIDLSAVQVLPPATKVNINNAVAGVTAVDFTATLAALNAITFPSNTFKTMGGDPDRSAAQAMISASNINAMKATATSWDALDTTDVPNILAQRDATVKAITALSGGLSALKPATDNVLVTADSAQAFLTDTGPNGASSMIKAAAKTYANRIISYFQQYVDFVKHSVLYDVGKCRPVYDSIHVLSNLLCLGIILPVNGIWLSMGLILILFIPVLFLNTCIGRYYSKAKDIIGPVDEIYEEDIIEHLGRDRQQSITAHAHIAYESPSVEIKGKGPPNPAPGAPPPPKGYFDGMWTALSYITPSRVAPSTAQPQPQPQIRV